MDSDLGQEQYSHHFQSKQQTSTGGGLTRYRSAPSSYLSSLMDNVGDLPPQPRSLSPETESILARFIHNVADSGPDSTPHKLYDIPENSSMPFMDSVKHETEQIQTFSTAPNNNLSSDFRLPNSNLMRHRSSPAGLFDNIIVQDGFLVNKEIGNYGPGSRSNTNTQINFSSGKARRFSNGDDDSLMNGFPATSWEDSAIFSGPESSGSDFNSPEIQKREERRRRPVGLLSHHLSLPKSSIEKLLQFQESSVPCKLRAKRGFATHPRSIAERVRRTKISERMRKLQDLVPNMDKQTNTSDMLDLAVDYIKELQKQVTTLTDKRDKCICTSLEAQKGGL